MKSLRKYYKAALTFFSNMLFDFARRALAPLSAKKATRL